MSIRKGANAGAVIRKGAGAWAVIRKEAGAGAVTRKGAGAWVGIRKGAGAGAVISQEPAPERLDIFIEYIYNLNCQAPVKLLDSNMKLYRTSGFSAVWGTASLMSKMSAWQQFQRKNALTSKA